MFWSQSQKRTRNHLLHIVNSIGLCSYNFPMLFERKLKAPELFKMVLVKLKTFSAILDQNPKQRNSRKMVCYTCFLRSPWVSRDDDHRAKSSRTRIRSFLFARMRYEIWNQYEILNEHAKKRAVRSSESIDSSYNARVEHLMPCSRQDYSE